MENSGGRGRWISEFETILVYRASSRIARTIQRNLVFEGWGGIKPFLAREMALQLRALAALPKHLGSVPCTHMAAHNCLQFQGIWHPHTGIHAGKNK